jgi:hypothetical protein
VTVQRSQVATSNEEVAVILNDRAINTPVRPVSRHQAEWAASGLRRAATEAGVALPIDYNPAGAADGLTRATQLAVSRLGAGVVLLTQPSSDRELPVVVATPMDEAQWYRDGHRHTTTTAARPPRRTCVSRQLPPAVAPAAVPEAESELVAL